MSNFIRVAWAKLAQAATFKKSCNQAILLIVFAIGWHGCSHSSWSRPLFKQTYQIVEIPELQNYANAYALQHGNHCFVVGFSWDKLLWMDWQIHSTSFDHKPSYTTQSHPIPITMPLHGFDLTIAPGQSNPWLALWIGEDLYFYPTPDGTGQWIGKISHTGREPVPGFFSPKYQTKLWYDLNRDHWPDLAIPFRKQMEWYMKTYLYINGSFRHAGTIHIGHPTTLIPPLLYHVGTLAKPVWMVVGNKIQYYSMNEQGQLIQEPGSILLPNSSMIDPLILRGIAQFNGQGHPELVFSDRSSQSLWILWDQATWQKMSFNGNTTVALGIYDANHDGWNDLMVGSLDSAGFLPTLGHYLFQSEIPLHFHTTVFWNMQGQFSTDSQSQATQQWYFPYPLAEPNHEVYCLDIYPDGLWDAVVVDANEMRIYYDIPSRISQKQEIPNWLNDCLNPLYQQILPKFSFSQPDTIVPKTMKSKFAFLITPLVQRWYPLF